jgi:hypothetical protein
MARDAGHGDTVEDLVDFVEPYVDPIIARINVDEFTTVEFIQAFNMDPETAAVYDEALRRWPERDPHLAQLVLHGQVIPQALRRSRLVEWAGYAYGEEDPYGVPAWWRKTTG